MMPPAFSSTRQAALFALLLLGVLLSPVLAGKNFLPPRKEIYADIPWRFGPFNHIRQEIFEENADIDILFIGSSCLWSAIDTPYLQQELSKKLGRPAVVQTLGWAWNGFDADYFVAQDLLQHRKVGMIVFYDETRLDDVPHPASRYWFRFGDDAAALRGLPWRIQAMYYFGSILEMPANLAGLLRTNIPDEFIAPENDHWQTFFHSEDSAKRMGALSVETIHGAPPGTPFVRSIPVGTVSTSDVCIYSPETRDRFHFARNPAPTWQLDFARKFAKLAQDHGTKLVELNLMPQLQFPDGPVNTGLIQEREFWPDALQADVAMVGVPSAKLYAGLTDSEREGLFYMLRHYNANGQQFFTRLVTPSLLKLYED
ncbi:MAG TPA: hypothetical protein VG347_25565 [Verrucomicrobiae bacterium]|nr:hypothetical protein [Verrucomicrobiae bacterium]